MNMTEHYKLMRLSLRELFEMAGLMGLTVKGAKLLGDLKFKGLAHSSADNCKFFYANLIINKRNRIAEIKTRAWHLSGFGRPQLRNLYDKQWVC